MTERQLQEYLIQHFPRENERCEWKAFTNLKNCVSDAAGDDIISYTSAISNMQGGCLVIGIETRSKILFTHCPSVKKLL
jgi:ATP-dependent DNA helicase RecG